MDLVTFSEEFVGKRVFVPTKRQGANVGIITGVAQIRADRFCFIDFGGGSWLGEQFDSVRILHPMTAKILEGKKIHVQGQGPYAVTAVDLRENPRLEYLKKGVPFVTPLDKVTRVDL